ncbi:MAG: hypothetical protein M3274_07065, partial [Actinomycetota bacterium]|nr:hypothetical protein [Actinomycetota bacterium]
KRFHHAVPPPRPVEDQGAVHEDDLHTFYLSPDACVPTDAKGSIYMVYAWCFRLPLWVVFALSPTSSVPLRVAHFAASFVPPASRHPRVTGFTS